MVSKPFFLKAIVSDVTRDLNSRQAALYYLLVSIAAAVPISIAASQVLLGVAAIYWAWLVFVARQWRIHRQPFMYPLAACFLTTLLAVLASANPANSATSLKKFVLFLIPLLAAEALRTAGQVRVLLQVVLATAVLSSLVALWQYPASTPLHRISGLLGHWQTFAGQQMMLCVVLFSLLLGYRRTRILHFICLLALGSALLFSETRGAWLGTAAGWAVVAYLKDKRLPAVLVMVMILSYWIMPSGLQERVVSIFSTKVESNAARLNMWSTGLNMIRAHPILGVGPNQITALAYNYGGNPRYEPRFFTHLHNNFLQLAAERGLPGLLAWLWLLAYFFHDLMCCIAAEKEQQAEFGVALGRGVLSALIAILVAGLVEFNLGDSEVLMLLLLLLSCACVMRPSSNIRKVSHANNL
jgi:O-antigen ligase